jgi:hypothetical protein
MALRDKLADRSRPFLPEGSQVRHVFVAQTGPNPWFFLLTYLIFFAIQYRTVAITDDAIYVLRSSKASGRPKELLGTMPRQTRLGPVSGMWGQTELLGQRAWVHKRFHKDIEAADYEAVRYTPPAAAPGAAPAPPAPVPATPPPPTA